MVRVTGCIKITCGSACGSACGSGSASARGYGAVKSVIINTTASSYLSY